MNSTENNRIDDPITDYEWTFETDEKREVFCTSRVGKLAQVLRDLPPVRLVQALSFPSKSYKYVNKMLESAQHSSMKVLLWIDLAHQDEFAPLAWYVLATMMSPPNDTNAISESFQLSATQILGYFELYTMIKEPSLEEVRKMLTKQFEGDVSLLRVQRGIENRDHNERLTSLLGVSKQAMKGKVSDPLWGSLWTFEELQKRTIAFREKFHLAVLDTFIEKRKTLDEELPFFDIRCFVPTTDLLQTTAFMKALRAELDPCVPIVHQTSLSFSQGACEGFLFRVATTQEKMTGDEIENTMLALADTYLHLETPQKLMGLSIKSNKQQ